MFKILGHEPRRFDALINMDPLLGVEIGDNLLGVLIPILPDGAVIEQDGQVYRTERGELRAYNMLEPIPLDCRPSARRSTADLLAEFHQELEAARRQARAYANRR